MVEHVLSGVEREHLKTSPMSDDDLEAKKALHKFLQRRDRPRRRMLEPNRSPAGNRSMELCLIRTRPKDLSGQHSSILRRIASVSVRPP